MYHKMPLRNYNYIKATQAQVGRVKQCPLLSWFDTCVCQILYF